MNVQYEEFQPGHKRSERSPGDRHPVVKVSWDDAQSFCRWLAEQTGKPMRLPSESEWECACRAGSETESAFGDDAKKLGFLAWYDENSQGSAHEVGTREGNVWGLHDLLGNVLEWCEDTYHENYLGAPKDGSAWTEGGVKWKPLRAWEASPLCRVIRGGHWKSSAKVCRSAFRYRSRPAARSEGIGFRPAFTLTTDGER